MRKEKREQPLLSLNSFFHINVALNVFLCFKCKGNNIHEFSVPIVLLVFVFCVSSCFNDNYL